MQKDTKFEVFCEQSCSNNMIVFLLLFLSQVVYGTSAEMARFRACAAYATVNLGQCVGRMFVKDNFQVGAKNMVCPVKLVLLCKCRHILIGLSYFTIQNLLELVCGPLQLFYISFFKKITTTTENGSIIGMI